MDLKLPVMAGIDLLESIRKTPLLAHIPVLIFSGSLYPQDIEKTKKIGANAYIVKPGRAEHFDDIASIIITAAESTQPWVFDNYIQQFGLN
jgi:CheY-like chemotaxis protein